MAGDALEVLESPPPVHGCAPAGQRVAVHFELKRREERNGFSANTSRTTTLQPGIFADGHRPGRALPEHVNYAVKSSYLLSFLESVPEVAATLKEPETKERKLEDVVYAAAQTAVWVLVY